MTTENQVIEQRIFIGNVDYKVNEEELKELFKDFNVSEVDIPTKVINRGSKVQNRHLGFAFVEFDSKAEADDAIAKFNNKSFKDRTIYIKKAVPPPTVEEKQKKIEEFKAKKAEVKAKKVAAKQAEPKRDPETSAKDPETASESKKPEKSNSSVDSGLNTDTGDLKDSSPKEKSIPEGKPSKDTIFITNLDYKVNAKTIKQLFQEFSPKWVHVPTRKVPIHVVKRSKEKGFSIFNKGIAFVKFPTEEAQKEALAKFNGVELNGREIIVDVAIDSRVSRETSIEE